MRPHLRPISPDSSSSIPPPDLSPVTALPRTGRSQDSLLAALAALKQGDADWRGGRCFSLVYSAGDAHEAFLERAHNTFFLENGLNPMAFQSLQRMEHEVVQMAASMLHGPPTACGTMTTGGTESLLLAVKAARDRARHKQPWIRRPEMIIPDSAHVAFDKAAHYFGVRIRRARLNDDKTVDVRHVRRLINKDTVLLVASAPQYPHGVIDDVAALGALALKRRIPLHVDACVGGFVLPFLEKLGVDVPPWDFRVPGVTSISADLHKYGYAAKGASVLVHRSMDTLRHQFFVATDWPGGVYASPSIPGTRAGGAIAAAWACLQALGEDGYLELARTAMGAAERLRRGIEAIDGLSLLSPENTTIVTWTTTPRGAEPPLSVYAIADRLEERGWHVDRQQKPPSVHLTVMAQHGPIVDDYLRDLAECAAHVRAHPEEKSQGNAAMYGMMAKVPFRGMVRSAVGKVLEGMYGPDGKLPDLSAPPDDLAGKLAARLGPRLDDALDRVDAAVTKARRLRARVRDLLP